MSESTTPPSAGRNSAAIASVVLGIAAIVSGLMIYFVLFFPLAVVAIVMGIKGIGDAKRIGRGRVTAIVGLSLGVLSLIAVPIAGVLLMPA